MTKVREIEWLYNAISAQNPYGMKVTFIGDWEELRKLSFIVEQAMNYNMDVELHNNRYKPIKIEYLGDKTKCTFPDGKVRVARPHGDDEFDPEIGVMACIAKQVYGSRSEFKRNVENAVEKYCREILEEIQEMLFSLGFLKELVTTVLENSIVNFKNQWKERKE
jgi:hypothetical protein